jgi:hypothetical protein
VLASPINKNGFVVALEQETFLNSSIDSRPTNVDSNDHKPRQMLDLTTATLSKLRWLGIYQIIGGAIGALLIIWGILNTQGATGLIILIYLFMLLFFVFSGYCGILCVKKDDNAVRLSLINQLLQIIGFAMFGFAFQYAAGVYLMAGLDLTESLNLRFGAGVSKFDFNFNNESERLEVTFNFVALGLVIFIEKLKKQIKEDQDKKQISSIAAG